MQDPYIGEIMLFAGNYAPDGWAFCNGQMLPIAQNSALFSLLGTTYGGDGQVTFGLPDLRGRTPIHFGQSPGLSDRVLGERAGVEHVTLNNSQIPEHRHSLMGNTGGANSGITNRAVLSNQEDADGSTINTFNSGDPNAELSALSIGTSGGGQPHGNMQPYLVINYCIALQGLYPPRQ